MASDLKIGVLALQGGFALHLKKLSTLGVEGVEVRTQKELLPCDGLIMPGGESTAIAILLKESGIDLLKFKKPVFATCAGLILLSKMGLLNVAVKRNAYGRQADSFSTKVMFQSQECEAVFIRAPRIQALLSSDVETLASLHGEPIMVRQKNLLGATFHPELTNTLAFHRFFCDGVTREKSFGKCG